MKLPRFAFVMAALILAGVLLVGYKIAKNIANYSAVHSVTLKWVPTPGATSYNVYRSSVGGGRYEKIGSAVNPTYVDTPVPSGGVLYYVVTTVENSKESGFSSEIKATVP
jgi:fibronectin type 3 domain-containing protein